MPDLSNQEKMKFSHIMYNSQGLEDQEISKLSPQEVSKLKLYYAQKIAFETGNAHLLSSQNNHNPDRQHEYTKVETICCCLYPENHRDKFDIRTKRFLKRCFGTYIFFRSSFLQIGENKPELYGPIWLTIAYTIVLAIAANLSLYFQANPISYHFSSSYIARAIGVVAIFKISQPFIYAAIVKCLGGVIQKMESAMITGYSMILYMLPTFLCFVPSTYWHLIMLAIGGLIRSIFLFRNYSPKIPAKSFTILIAALVIEALYVMVVLKVMFFKVAGLEIYKGTDKIFHMSQIPQEYSHGISFRNYVD